MQLQLSTWPEVEAYLARSKAILIPIGSTEQHGPNGLLGTDALCPEIISRRAGDEAGILIGPTFNVGQAQHHMGFSGTITLRPSTMIAAMLDWTQSLTRHGFERIYWLNGHGGNLATITAAFSEIYHGVTFGGAGGNRPPLRCHLRNWWELPGVMDLCRQLFPVWLSRIGQSHGDEPQNRAAWSDPGRRRLPPPLSRRPHRFRSQPGQHRGGRENRRFVGQRCDRGIPPVRKFLSLPPARPIAPGGAGP